MRWTIVDLKSVARTTHTYNEKTTEHYRLDMHHLPPAFNSRARQFAKTVAAAGGPYVRQHMQHRLRQYVNKWSRGKRYIEILPEEVPEIDGGWTGFMHYPDLTLVEVGFNADKHVCKLAYTCTLKSTGRVLFLCIGAGDYGLKTFYVNPTYKRKAVYHYSDKKFRGGVQWRARKGAMNAKKTAKD